MPPYDEGIVASSFEDLIMGVMFASLNPSGTTPHASEWLNRWLAITEGARMSAEHCKSRGIQSSMRTLLAMI